MTEEIEDAGDAAIEVVVEWLSKNGLGLAAKKTGSKLIFRTKKRKYATSTIEERKSTTTDIQKYLGVTLDSRLSFKEYPTTASLKASEVAGVLTGMMPNIGGPKQLRRLLLA